MENALQAAPVDRLVRLSYDEVTGCWMDDEGQAWTVTATADIVDLVRTMADESNECPICGKRFGTKRKPTFKRRRDHVLNGHSSWSRR